jgi:hypothetical protein
MEKLLLELLKLAADFRASGMDGGTGSWKQANGAIRHFLETNKRF